jgi:hypothetical protein
MTDFNYDADDTPDDVVRSVAASMSDTALKPLTDVEIAEREEWRREHLVRMEEERRQSEQHRLEREREREAVAQREAAAAAQLARERARAERQHQFDRELRRRDMLDLRMAAARQDAFAKKVEDSHIQAARQQYTASLMAELDRAINEAVPLTKPSPSFSTLYRQNQRSGLFYTTPEDSDE